MKLTDILERTVRYYPDWGAVSFKGQSWTWSQFHDRAQRLGSALGTLGVKAGDRVATLSYNSNRHMEMFFGPFYADAVLVPLNYRWAIREMVMCMEDCRPEILFADDAHIDAARDIAKACEFCRHLVYIGNGDLPDGFLDYETLLAENAPGTRSGRGGENLAALFYTGGTTGRSKGVMLTHANLCSNALGVMAAHHIEEGGGFLQSAPIFHLAAGSRVYSLTMAAARSVLMEKFTPEGALEIIEEEKITEALFVPTMINMIFNVPNFDDYDLSSLHHISYGAAPMPETLVRKVMAKLPNVDFYQGYGMTEASPLVTRLGTEVHDPDGPLADKLASIGRPVFHVDLRIVDENDNDISTGEVGELIVRGPNIMKGYWNLPELTAEALRGGWYHTGDIGYFDDDRYIFLVDRIKDMIVTGGENVYSTEVESVIHEHPAIKECAVIGIPDEKWGEAVHAIITLKAGRSVDEQELIDFCHERIAGYKCPGSVKVIAEMPFSGANKILKMELRKPYWEGHESGVI